MNIAIAIPALDEIDFLPACLESLKKQTYTNFQIYICVNQPEIWWNSPDKINVCHRNQQTIKYLKSIDDLKIHVIDHSSKGMGWTQAKAGVGIARKCVLDCASAQNSDDTLLVSLDADTITEPEYLTSLLEQFTNFPEALGMAIPYYHPLTNKEPEDRAILRYEIYMRYYTLNLCRIGSPYHFSALGSAIAVRNKAYKKVKGLDPKASGEDFYFLQKITKAGQLLTWNPITVFPAARFSNRVGFGTGPAMIKGNAGDWNSYPIYDFHLFNQLQELFSLFEQFFINPEIHNLPIHFHPEINHILSKLRKNYPEKNQFIRACHSWFDGLRTLQFLKSHHKEYIGTDEERLLQWLQTFHPQHLITKSLSKLTRFQFNQLTVQQLNTIRNFLFEEEMLWQKHLSQTRYW